ncbi:hypothetical protein MU666_22825, partial [Salmonella enterica subsp. enterica serovar Enteritidis]|nr:hypothetical protein [Salmonella enterica subsp. enterica serovar Enteritidis]
PQNDVTLKMPAFEWVHVQLHQQKGMISLSPPTICNSAVARMLQKIKYQDSEVLKDCLGDFFIYEQREKLRRLGVITNWGINKTADGKNNKL